MFNQLLHKLWKTFEILLPKRIEKTMEMENILNTLGHPYIIELCICHPKEYRFCAPFSLKIGIGSGN